MSRLLFIGPDHQASVGGREQLSRLHRTVLRDLLDDSCDIILLPRAPLAGAAALAAAFSGRIDGADREAQTRILDHIERHGIARVWLDGSNLGVLARAIKHRFPTVEVLTFFHNIEPRFFWGALRQRPGPRAVGVLAASWRAERMAARFSDRRIMLNRRDAELLRRLYRRSATDLLPMAIADGWKASASSTRPQSRALLFVGGSFYANRSGIAWYAKQVAPAAPVDTIVVGNGMDRDRAALEAFPNIKVVGPVDDLAPWYRDALAVVAPLFDGSGMKTKVAEALMYGKRVIGTVEAFTGYEGLETGTRCDTREAFVAAIAAVAANPPPTFDPALRALYERHFSAAALRAGLARILTNPIGVLA